jgi:hypothetical protein
VGLFFAVNSWHFIVATIKSGVDFIMSVIQKVVNAYNAVKSFFGGGKANVNIQNGQKAGLKTNASPANKTNASPVNKAKADMQNAKNAVNKANASPVNAINSRTIQNYAIKREQHNNVTVSNVTVNTQATDASGISKSIGNELGAHMKRAIVNFDNGVIG